MDKFQLSKNNGIHSQLARLEGNRAGITRTWFEPDVLSDESPMKGTMKPVLEGRFMLYQYEGMITANPSKELH